MGINHQLTMKMIMSDIDTPFKERPYIIPYYDSDGIHIALSLYFPSPGEIFLPNGIGSLHLNQQQELYVTGELSYDTIYNTEFKMQTTNGMIENSVNELLSPVYDHKLLYLKHIPIVFWGIAEDRRWNLYQRIQDVINHLDHIPANGIRTIVRGIYNGSGISFVIIGTLDERNTLSVYDAMAGKEMKILSSWINKNDGNLYSPHSPHDNLMMLDYVIWENQEPVLLDSIIKREIQQIYQVFSKCCETIGQAKKNKNGQYAARFIPYNSSFYSSHLGSAWFRLSRIKNMPAFYRGKIFSDGSLAIPYPDFCDTWTQTQFQKCITAFLQNDLHWMYIENILWKENF